ncbi:MAG: polyprenyl synthetase family protein [Candidatus Binataceae bacterium]
MFKLERYLKERAALIEAALAGTVVPHDGPAAPLYESMRYSVLGGGKRLRPILALASCEAVGGRTGDAINFACAIEMIHTYSMIHDDLPCMDDDDLRRGRPTNHKVYGEAIATLAGDGLLTDAFKVLARSVNGSRNSRAEVVLQTVAELSEAAGSGGMVEGQSIDLLAEGKPMELAQLEYLHSKKTGALFMVAVRGGARMGGASDAQVEELSAYARAFGLAFQVVDDLLDVESSTEQVGKRTQKDHARGKATYPSLLGVERSHQLAGELVARAHAALASFGDDAQALRHLATYVVERKL